MLSNLFRPILFVAVAAMADIGAAHASCFTVSASPGSVSVAYSPLDGADKVQSFQIQVHNNSCGSGAGVAIGAANVMVDAGGHAAGLRMLLNYNAELHDGAGSVVLSSNSDQIITASAGTFDEGQTASETWYVSIPAHSVVPYVERDFSIYVVAAVGGVYEYAQTPVHLNVATVTQLSFGGGGTALTMDFGELVSGQNQSVNVNVQSTVPFDITSSSEANGVLKNLGDTSWSIPYTATLNGTAINNATPYTDTTDGGTQGAIVSWPLAVTIGDATNKRAGTYRDIITIAIKPHA